MQYESFLVHSRLIVFHFQYLMKQNSPEQFTHFLLCIRPFQRDMKFISMVLENGPYHRDLALIWQ